MKLPLIHTVALALLAPLVSAQEIKLLPSDGTPGDDFGHSVAIDGGIAIVGAPSHGATGAAYLFDTSTGLETAHLVPNDGASGDRFGHSVSISGTTAIVGSIYHNPNGTTGMGAAYLFNTTSGAQIGKLVPSDPTTSDHFGNSVGISGDTAIVGSFAHDGPHDSGAAYLFDITTGAELFKLKASDATESDAFGHFVAISGNTAIIGARYDDIDGVAADSGSAYLFDTTNGTELFKLTASDGQANDYFGWCVDISGNTAIVGAWNDYHNGVQTGSAYLFDTTNGTEIAKLTGSDAGYDSEFGLSVAITFGTAIVGARYNDSIGFDSGSAYLFDTSTGAETDRFIASDGQPGDAFGWSVACAGGKAIVGAPGVDDAGAAYLITTPFDCDSNGVLDDIDIANDPSLDCDQSGAIDYCEMIAYDRDCNFNGIYDPCECLAGTTPDCNDNLIPDLCEGLEDCNSNGVYDLCECLNGTAPDCNDNLIPDECDIASGLSSDCNRNDVPDECETDCNGNGTPDDCEVFDDCNQNDIPDECEADCNDNLIPDECDIASGLSSDCNRNDVPDECETLDDCDSDGESDACEIANGTETDLNGNVIPDNCECLATSYCPENPNTVGSGVQISITGIPSITLNNLGIDAIGGPTNQPGLFFHGPGTASQPFGEGIRCVTAPISRVETPVFFGAGGTANKQVDMNAAAQSSIQAADTRYFQLWYRDPTGGPAGFNLSNGLEVTFCP